MRIEHYQNLREESAIGGLFGFREEILRVRTVMSLKNKGLIGASAGKQRILKRTI